MNSLDWKINFHSDITPNNPVFIEGLPGIGNVGKIVVDFLIEKTGAELLASFFSYALPNSVFVNENNLVELPKIELYYSVVGDQELLFLTGDVQPVDEVASYLFCESILKNVVGKFGVQRIITLGGIGLQEDPEKPVVYSTGNNSAIVKEFVKFGVNPKVYGVVGPVIGVSGLLLGLANVQGVSACALLAETLGHPMHIGIRSAKAILEVLNARFGLSVPLDDLEKELADGESDEDSSPSGSKKLDTVNKLKKYRDINYIG